MTERTTATAAAVPADAARDQHFIGDVVALRTSRSDDDADVIAHFLMELTEAINHDTRRQHARTCEENRLGRGPHHGALALVRQSGMLGALGSSDRR